MPDNEFQKKNIMQPKEKKRLHYSLLTFVLIICIIELLVSSMSNINKNINFVSKIRGLENKRNQELDKNKQLKFEIENFNSEITYESIIRNDLKMAGKNEILVIINKQEEEPKEDTSTNSKKKNKKRSKKL